MLGTADVIAQAAAFRAQKMGGDVEGRIGQRAAEVTGLGVVAQQHQGHAGHEPDIFKAGALFGAQRGVFFDLNVHDL